MTKQLNYSKSELLIQLWILNKGGKMPKMITANSESKIVPIETALLRREAARKNRTVMPKYLCIECGNPVRPHKAGQSNQAHFEHLKRNINCSKSDKNF